MVNDLMERIAGSYPRSSRGNTPGVTFLGALPEGIEENMVNFSRKTKRQKARENGTYALGRSQFRIRKGDPIPDGAIVTYESESEEEVVDTASARARRIAENTSEDVDEVTSEDDGEEVVVEDDSEEEGGEEEEE